MSREIRFIRLSDLLTGPDLKPRYLIEGLIPARDITVVWGKPKSGKTFIVLDMALHVASGRPYRGRHVVQGSVAYCALEGAGPFPDRLRALCRAYDLAAELTPFWLSSDRFVFIRERRRDPKGGVSDLIRAIKETLPNPPRLIVIDTLNRSLSGSENSDDDMTHYTRCVERISEEFEDCSVVVIHHCGVSADKPRGHTSLTGTCAAQLKVDRINKGPFQPEESTMVCLTAEFMKDGPEGAQLFSWLQVVKVGINEAGQDITTCHVVEAPQPTAVKSDAGMRGQTKKALAILQAAASKNEGKRVSVYDWREGCIVAKIAKTKDASKRAFYRSMERLQLDGIIHVDGQWVSLTKQDFHGNGPAHEDENEFQGDRP